MTPAVIWSVLESASRGTSLSIARSYDTACRMVVSAMLSATMFPWPASVRMRWTPLVERI